ncbi:MAG TPA: ATP-binding protein [Bryobacteraceae bacterium]|nr:ATP-binding protein [Bryobacteraceae bacterium]
MAHPLADWSPEINSVISPWPSRGGAMSEVMRSLDWSKTSIGPISSWSPTLRAMVSFLLANRFPLLLWWGPEFCQIYNDAYRPVLGAKHPKSMGQPASQCWPEVWHIIGPLIETPFRGGPSTWLEDLAVEINRHGFMEEAHFTVAYSPVPEEGAPGGIGGVLATVHEISEKVVGDRRVLLLRDLGALSADSKTAEDACLVAARILAQYPKDAPFALLYLISADCKTARLAGAAGVGTGEAASPLIIDLAEGAGAVWPLAETIREESLHLVENLSQRLTNVPRGPWSDPPDSAVLMPIRSNAPHQLAGVMVMGVSRRLRFDDAYRGFCDLLASQVAAGIANARAYEEERKRAEALAEIDRAKTTFFSNVSHEFRTPLTLMLGPLEEMLARAELKPEQRDELELVHRNGLRMQKLVNTLLDFSRIEADRAQAVFAAADLDAVTRELTSNFRSLVERAGLTLTVDCEPLPEPVYLDHEMWEKIVFNLLSNAFKFTLAGGISVSVKAAGSEAILSVADTGVGIPKEDVPRVFERFHRVEATRGRTYEGTGIGLALVRELVRLHGGTVSVESTLGEGSIFRVRIPFGSAHLPQDRIGAKREMASTALSAAAYVEEAARWLPISVASPSPLAAGMGAAEAAAAPALEPAQAARILVADDNIDMREYVYRILSGTYHVEMASNGEEALAMARQTPPNLILSDVMMPGMDGFALLRALRREETTRSIPVLLVSARAGEEARIEGLQQGADDYLIKPFSARELRARVEARLELDRVRQQASRAVRESEERLDLAVQVGKLGAWELDLVSRQFTCTARLKANFGRPPGADFTRQDLFDSIHPEDRARVSAAVEHAIASGEEYEAEYRCVWPDGSLHWIVARGRRFSDGGQPARMVGITLDNTKQKQVAAQLEAELADTRLLQSVSAELIREEQVEILYGRIVAAARSIMRSDFASLQILLPKPGQSAGLRLLAFHGFDPQAAVFWGWISPESYSACGAALRSSRRVILPDIERADFLKDTPDLAAYRQAGVRAVQATPLISRNGGVLGMISTHWREPFEPTQRDLHLLDILARQAADLIERRLAAEALFQRTAQFETLLNEAPLGVYLVDADFCIRQVNPTALPVFGDIPGLIGRDFCEVIHILWPKAYADEIVRIFRRTLETGEPYSVPEHAEQRLDRGIREYYEWQIHRIPVLDGRYGVVCYFRDISAQVRARLAIAESEERLRFMAESMPQKIFTATAAGYVDYVNEQWTAFAGIPEEQLQGWGWLEIVHPEDVAETLRLWKNSIKTREPFQCVHRFLRADGTYRWHLSRARALHKGREHVSLWIGSNTEIQEQKQIEEELRRLNSDLNQFAFAASHDLQEPLRMVTSYTQLLLDNCGGELNEEAALSVGFIKEGTRRMRALLSDLLAYTQVGNRAAQFKSVDFNQVLKDALRNLEASIQESGAVVTSGHLPVARGQSAHILQLLQNLIGNAIKYRSEDAPRIHISAEPQAGGMWRFAVADNGIGIDPEYHRTIFGVFKRLHGRAIPGTGIGLAICQRVVECHGGKIWVDSRPGFGSTFYFTLPRRKEKADEQ